MKKLLSLLIALALTMFGSPAHAADSTNKETASVLGVVDTPLGTINVWRGDVPTKVWIEPGYSGKPCDYIAFSIEALIPYEQLDKLNSAEVAFELWSPDGEKIGSDSIYRSTWNPVGPLTKVKIFDCDDNGYGDFILRIKTKYQVSTTGLISRYYENVIQQNLTVAKPPTAPTQMSLPKQGSWTGGVLKFSYKKPSSASKILRYEIGFSQSKSSASSKNPSFGSTYKVLKSVKASAKTFSIVKADLKKLFTSRVNFASVTIRAVSDAGPGEWASGWYYSKSQSKGITK